MDSTLSIQQLNALSFNFSETFSAINIHGLIELVGLYFVSFKAKVTNTI